MTTSVRQLAGVKVFMLDPGAERAWVLECVPVTVYGAARTSIRLIARTIVIVPVIIEIGAQGIGVWIGTTVNVKLKEVLNVSFAVDAFKKLLITTAAVAGGPAITTKEGAAFRVVCNTCVKVFLGRGREVIREVLESSPVSDGFGRWVGLEGEC